MRINQSQLKKEHSVYTLNPKGLWLVIVPLRKSISSVFFI